MACLRVRGSAETEEAASAQPCPRMPSDATPKQRWRRVTKRAAGCEERTWKEPRPRWKRARWVAPSAAACSRSGAALSGSADESEPEACSGCCGGSFGASRGAVGKAGAAVGKASAGCVAGAACNVSEARGRSDAMARAMPIFKSGGYAADR
eukprot:1414352-Pleurochrysis_carterae.AAC.1